MICHYPYGSFILINYKLTLPLSWLAFEWLCAQQINRLTATVKSSKVSGERTEVFDNPTYCHTPTQLTGHCVVSLCCQVFCYGWLKELPHIVKKKNLMSSFCEAKWARGFGEKTKTIALGNVIWVYDTAVSYKTSLFGSLHLFTFTTFTLSLWNVWWIIRIGFTGQVFGPHKEFDSSTEALNVLSKETGKQ